MAEERATAPEAEQTPEQTPQQDIGAGAEAEVQPSGEAGAQQKNEGADRLAGLERRLEELQQGLAVKDTRHKADLEQVRQEANNASERRIRQAVEKTKADLAADRRQVEIAQLKRQITDGDEEAIVKLGTLASEPLEQARQAEEAQKVRSEGQTSGWIQGYATSMNRRLERLEPTDERRGEFTAIWDTGKFEELEAEMAKAETAKAGGPSTETIAELQKRLDALEKGNTAVSEEEAAMNAREDGGADLGGGTPSGGKKYAELKSDERRAMSSADIDVMLARERGER